MGRRLQSLASALTGAVTAAGVMYYFDGSNGRERRSRLEDRSAMVARRGLSRLETVSRDLVHRLGARTVAWWHRGQVPAAVLAERVRARVARAVTHPDAVHVHAEEDRTVRLGGAVLAWELHPLREAVAAVPGIGRVVAELAVFESAERVRAILGGSIVQTRTPEGGRNPSTALRLLMALAGSSLLLGGARRRGKLGAVGAAAGGMLLLRSVAPRRRRTRTVGPPVELSRTLHVNASVESVFAALREPGRLVGALRPLRSLRRREDGSARWTLSDTDGWPVECVAEVTELQPNRQIAWRSTADSPVSLWGMIWLEPMDPGQTRLQLYISCRGAPGRTGAALRGLAGMGPRQHLDQHLSQLRQLLEAGTAQGAQAPAPKSDVLSVWTRPADGRTH